MITPMLLGAGTGLGLWALAIWVRPPLPSLAQVLAQLTGPPALPVHDGEHAGWATRIGHPLGRVLTDQGLPRAAMRRDLLVVGHDPAAHLASQATCAIFGLLTPPAFAAALLVLGAPIGVGIPAAAAVACAAVGFLLPDLQIRREAARRREDFRHALSAYLDLVVVSLAGGAGVDSALADAATIGHGWAFTQLRHTLDTARLTRTTPWAALRQLGEDLDVPELTELAASVALAGTEGAKVRASLAAKADTLRAHLLHATETAASSATERMSVPWVLLFLGFLVFIGYPATHQILTTL